MDSSTSDSNRVIITGDLERRPSRAPDYQAEAHALTALAETMSTNPDSMLQRLVEVAMELTRSDSAGISLLEPGGENGTFRWVATTGAWSSYRDGTMPREASPCGEVIAREAVVLMKSPERSFPALLQAEPGISEGLLAPFHLDGVPVGTLWTIKHRPHGHFEAEDARVLKSLARFASAGHQTVQALHLAKAAGQQAELRAQQLVSLAEVSNDFFGTCDMDFMPIYGNPAAMRMVGLADLDEVKRTPVQEFFFPEDLPFITDEFFPRVLREGQGKTEIRFRHFATGEPVWVEYSLVVLSDEMGRATGLGTVTHDLTERKRAELALRESEKRHAFLLKLSDTLRPLRDPLQVQTATMRLVVEHLGIMRASYFSIDPDLEKFTLNASHDRGALPIPDHMRLSDFAPDMADGYRKGRTFVLEDAETEALSEPQRAAYRSIGVRAAVGVPLVKDGILLGVFGVHSATPRLWSVAEIELLQNVADRIWTAVDRAYAEEALGESEERQTFLLKLSDALRPLSDAAEILTTTTGLLGTHMCVDRVMYAEVDGEQGAETGTIRGQYVRPSSKGLRAAVPFPEHFTFGPFGAHTMAARYRGETLVIENIDAAPGFAESDRNAWALANVRAAVVAALAKGGCLVAEFGVHSAVPRDWTPAEVSLIEEVAERTWAAVERGRAKAASRDSKERFRQFSDASTNILWIRNAATMRMEFASPAFDTAYGFPGPDRGGDDRLASWARLIKPEDRKQVLANFRRVRAGEYVEQEFRVRHGSDGEIIWIRDVGFPLLDEQGRVRAVAGVGQDITAQKRAEEALHEREVRQGVLVAELQHRTRNLMAIVRSTSDKTARSSADLPDFLARFGLRLGALARVQGLLSRLTGLDRVTFDDLIRTELSAMSSEQDKITLEGPSGIWLKSAAVQTLAMAIHELATNAVKYGALGQADARLFVTWRWESSGDNSEPWLQIDWRETGVEMAAIGATPRGTGQGRELIERALPYQLSAKTSFELGRDGVHCTISLPVSATVAPEDAHD